VSRTLLVGIDRATNEDATGFFISTTVLLGLVPLQNHFVYSASDTTHLFSVTHTVASSVSDLHWFKMEPDPDRCGSRSRGQIYATIRIRILTSLCHHTKSESTVLNFALLGAAYKH
jgi:hypothetical protein